jgi:hypothetical protein
MKTTIIIAMLLCILGVAVLWATSVWISVGDVPMSYHAWIALGLMVVCSLAVGVGLMALLFFSARHGYDNPPDSER